MKLFNKFLTALSLTLILFSCNNDETKEIIFTPVKVQLAIPENYENAKMSGITVSLKNINTEDTKEAKTNAEGIAEVVVEEGVYKISATADLSIVSEGLSYDQYFAGDISSKSFTGNEEMTVDLMLNPSQKSTALLFKEIYISGSRTEKQKSYWGDQYFVIFNNSDEVQDIRGLAIGETDDVNAFESNWELTDGVALGVTYVVPFDGEGKKELKPGESLVLAQFPINMKGDTHPNYVNANSPISSLANADYQWFEDFNGFDVDVAEVPNLKKYYSYSRSIWIPSTQGNKGYILFKTTDQDAETFYKKHELSRKTSWGADAFAVKIPFTEILDAVELFKDGDVTPYKLFPTFLDESYTYFTGSFSGKSVKRKEETKNGRVYLIDTNNSAEDFESDAVPTSNPTN